MWEGGAGSCGLVAKLCEVLPPSAVIIVIVIVFFYQEHTEHTKDSVFSMSTAHHTNLKRSRHWFPNKSQGCSDREREKCQRTVGVAVPVLLRYKMFYNMILMLSILVSIKVYIYSSWTFSVIFNDFSATSYRAAQGVLFSETASLLNKNWQRTTLVAVCFIKCFDILPLLPFSIVINRMEISQQ